MVKDMVVAWRRRMKKCMALGVLEVDSYSYLVDFLEGKEHKDF